MYLKIGISISMYFKVQGYSLSAYITIVLLHLVCVGGGFGVILIARLPLSMLILIYRSSRLKILFKIRCSQKFHNIHRKISVMEFLFIKVTCLKAYNFDKRRLWHRYFPVNIAKFLRTAFLQNTSDGCFRVYWQPLQVFMEFVSMIM